MPPVRHLGGQRRALRSAFGVTPATVTADDLCARVGGQPGAEGLRGPLRENVHRTAGFDIDQHRAVDMPLAQREVVDAEHQRSPAIGVGAARISRISVERLTAHASLPVSRVPARPPWARLAAASTACRAQGRRP